MAEIPKLLAEGNQHEFALQLYQLGLFGINPDRPQTLKSGRDSFHYLNVRDGISYPSFRHYMAREMAKLATIKAAKRGFPTLDTTYHHIAGTPEAMISYATTIADFLGMSLLQPRVATGKKTGNKAPILGRYRAGDRVAAFDDVVTEGQSKIDQVGVFRSAGLEVSDYYVVLDREEGGAPHVQEATGLEITPALGVSSVVRYLRAERLISPHQYDLVARYLDRYGEPQAQEAMNQAL